MTVIAPVPPKAGYPRFGEVLSGEPVRASTWTDAADSILNSLGSTNIFVPYFSPVLDIPPLSTRTLRFQYTPNGRATQIRWIYWLDDGTGTGDLPIRLARTVKLASKSSTTTTIAFSYSNVTTNTQRIVAITGYEDTMRVLEDIDLGVKPATYQIREPIAGVAYESIGGLFESATANFRRYYLNHSDSDATDTAWKTSTTTLASIAIKDGVILTRKRYPTSVYGSTQWRVRAAVSNTNYGGRVKITNTVANIVNYLVIPNTSFALINTFYSFNVPRSFTWSKVGSATATLTRNNHGFTTGDNIYVDSTTSTVEVPLGVYSVTSTGTNTITINTGVVGTATGTCTNDMQFGCEDYTDPAGLPGGSTQFYTVNYASENAAGTFYLSNIACEEVI